MGTKIKAENLYKTPHRQPKVQTAGRRGTQMLPGPGEGGVRSTPASLAPEGAAQQRTQRYLKQLGRGELTPESNPNLEGGTHKLQTDPLGYKFTRQNTGLRYTGSTSIGGKKIHHLAQKNPDPISVLTPTGRESKQDTFDTYRFMQFGDRYREVNSKGKPVDRPADKLKEGWSGIVVEDIDPTDGGVKYRQYNQPFDPEGKSYDYEMAKKYGIRPDKTGHWPSRVPETGLLLKGKGHKTWKETVKAEAKHGYKIVKGEGGRYYSFPIEENETTPTPGQEDDKLQVLAEFPD